MGILRTDKISGLETPTPVTGSVFFDGSGDYLQTPDSEIFSLEKNDYTIEGWFYFTTLSATQRLFGQRASNASERQMLMETNASGELTYYFDISNSPKTVGGVVATRINTWHHIAVVRKNLVHTLYVDGVSVATNSTDTGTLENRPQPFSIGRQGDYTSDAFNGHISNFRICKGTAVYTSDFTVPTHALEVTQDTVLLCCNNPDSVTASDHGTVGAAPPTLTANGDPTVSSINPGLTRDFTGGTEFRGVTTFDTQGYFVPPSGTTTQRGSGRGIVGGVANAIHYIQIHTSGNSQDFGDLTHSPSGYTTSYGSSTRGLIAGGYDPMSNVIDYITIASTGNAKEFGDISLTNGVYSMGPAGSNTRGLFAGGWQSPGSPNAIAAQAQINYVTMQTLGNSQDFGDLIQGVRYPAGFSSPTRAIFAAGRTNDSAPAANKNVIQYVTIATLGDATDFGDLTYSGSDGVYSARAVYSSTRGVIGGGVISPAYVNSIDYVTITSLGNSQEFGDLPGTGAHIAPMSSKDRGVFAGGYAPAATNVMSFVTITSTGDAKDFGDLYSSMAAPSGMSDSHGGIA